MALTVEAVRAAVETDVDPATLKRLLDSAVAAVDRAAGKATSSTATHLAHGLTLLTLRRRRTSITSIVEYRRAASDPVTLSTDDYRVVGDYELLRLTGGTNSASAWGYQVDVTFVPEVDQDIRDRVAIDLVKVDLEFRSFDSETVGDWKGEQKDWKARRRELFAHVREGRSPIT